MERFLLNPVFAKNIKHDLPQIMRITDHDSIHENSPVCKKAIGFKDIVRGKEILNIYTRFVDKTDKAFYPILSEGIYLADPYCDNQYLAYDNYYSFLKNAKVTELTSIAQSLGAKHIKIIWEEDERQSTNREKKVKETVDTKVQGSVSSSYDHSDSIHSTKHETILYESDFPGSDPVEPVLQYFKSEAQILNLIKGRLYQNNPLNHQVLILEQKSTCGIKRNDAVAVDAALKKYDIATGKSSTSFKIETEREYRSRFKYEIDF